MSYWDTSALAKLYLQEPDSAAFRRKAVSDAPLHTAHLARHELCTVLFRRESEGAIQQGSALLLMQDFEEDIAGGLIVIQEESPDVRRHFVSTLQRCLLNPAPIFVRTNDALHVASAQVAGQTEFVTADSRQRSAAAHVGLNVH